MPPPLPPPTAKCPKCGRLLRASGVAEGEGIGAHAVFTCDECLRTVDFAGEKMELPLTFCVDAAGRAYDPADPGADLTK